MIICVHRMRHFDLNKVTQSVNAYKICPTLSHRKCSGVYMDKDVYERIRAMARYDKYEIIELIKKMYLD